MKIKTYVVPTLSEAVQQIKQDLGPQAVIMSTRKVNSDKWWQRGEPMLEVTAAIDIPDEKRESIVNRESTEAQATHLVGKMAEAQIQPLKDEIALLRESINKISEVTPVVATERQVNSAVEPLIKKLAWNRVDSETIEELMAILGGEEMAKGTASELWGYSVEWLMKRVPNIEEALKEEKRHQVRVIIGPTGAGKTTTLIKLASRVVLNENKTVACIDLSHETIASDNMLSHYAELFEIPYTRAASSEELSKLLEGFRGYDVILIDTSGFSLLDESTLSRMIKILTPVEVSWRYLVLPCFLQGQDLQKVVEAYQELSPNTVVISKLDESACFGTLLSAITYSSLPLTYLTLGQQIPDDIEEASAARVVDCLLDLSREGDSLDLSHRETETAGGLSV